MHGPTEFLSFANSSESFVSGTIYLSPELSIILYWFEHISVSW